MLSVLPWKTFNFVKKKFGSALPGPDPVLDLISRRWQRNREGGVGSKRLHCQTNGKGLSIWSHHFQRPGTISIFILTMDFKSMSDSFSLSLSSSPNWDHCVQYVKITFAGIVKYVFNLLVMSLVTSQGLNHFIDLLISSGRCVGSRYLLPFRKCKIQSIHPYLWWPRIHPSWPALFKRLGWFLSVFLSMIHLPFSLVF